MHYIISLIFIKKYCKFKESIIIIVLIFTLKDTLIFTLKNTLIWRGFKPHELEFIGVIDCLAVNILYPLSTISNYY